MSQVASGLPIPSAPQPEFRAAVASSTHEHTTTVEHVHDIEIAPEDFTVTEELNVGVSISAPVADINRVEAEEIECVTLDAGIIGVTTSVTAETGVFSTSVDAPTVSTGALVNLANEQVYKQTRGNHCLNTTPDIGLTPTIPPNAW